MPLGMLIIALLLGGYVVRRWARRRQRGFYQAAGPHLDGGEAAYVSQGRSRLATLITTEMGSMSTFGMVSQSPLPAGALHHVGSSVSPIGAWTDAEVLSETEGGTASARLSSARAYHWGLESRSLELLPGELQVSLLAAACCR